MDAANIGRTMLLKLSVFYLHRYLGDFQLVMITIKPVFKYHIYSFLNFGDIIFINAEFNFTSKLEE